MNEDVLGRFFEGGVSATDLARDLEGSIITGGPRITRYPVADMTRRFRVDPAHLVKVCDAVLEGAIQPRFLEAVGFCLVASDALYWDWDTVDGQRVAEVANDWSSPEINYPLTAANVAEGRRLLLGEPARFQRD